MNLQADLQWIISELQKVKDPELLRAFKTLLKHRQKENPNDWWDVASPEERQAIDEGISQHDKGESIPYEEVKSEIDRTFDT